MISKTLTAILLFCTLQAATQLPVLNWAKAFNDNGSPSSNAGGNSRTVGVDLQGNVYTAGLFGNSVDFDPGPGVFSMVSAGISKNIFISKLDGNGNFVWAKQIPTYVEFGRINLKVDGAGNVYLTSDLNLAADMDPGAGVFMMKPTGFRDAFILKLNTDGDFIWAKQLGGPGDTGPQADMIELDQNNNVIVAGIFNNTVDFDPGPGLLTITSSAHMQAFIVKLTNSGDFLWAKQFGNGPEIYSGCHISDLKCDLQGNIVCTGTFARSVDFDPGPNVYQVTSSPGAVQDGFICKLDSALNFIWVKTLDQNGTNNHFLLPTGLAIDGMNNIITTGLYIGNYDFDPGPGTQIVYSNPHDAYILKLDQQGKLVWAKTIGDSESDAGYDVAVDKDNNVYTIGSFGTSVDFDPGPGVYTINSPYYGASVLLKLSLNGDFVYAAPFQSLNYGSSYFSRMVLDAAGNIYITGTVSGENDFDPGPKVYSFSGSNTSFVMKLSRCLNVTRSTLTISACSSYALNNHVYNASGAYQQTLPNVSGCDSIITLLLVINKKMTEQTKAICEGDFFYAGGKNQTTPGTYTDTLLTTLGCDSIVTTFLTVHPKPMPNLGPDKSLCSNIQLTISPGVFRSYVWQDGSQANNLIAKAARMYWVKVTNEFNCTAIDTFNVRGILPVPTNFLKDRDSLCTYEQLELITANTYTNYQWSTGAAERKTVVKQPGIYWLSVTDANGCMGTDSISVFPKQCMSGVYVPTAFTPNGDGKNDFFKASVFGNVLSFNLSVFDKWGNVVFQTTDYGATWNGRIKGMDYSTGVFVWYCSYQLEGQSPAVQKGTVTLIH